MGKVVLIILQLALLQCGNAQEDPGEQMVLNPEFEETIKSFIEFSIPVISCEMLHRNMDQFILLDTRAYPEYQVSHLKNAHFVGYEDFNVQKLSGLDKSKPVVVYCSIGYRSEKIGEKLRNNGFSKVYNLYGSIFEWINQDYPVYDENDNPVSKVHTYNRKWSKWVDNPAIEKVW